MKKIISGFIAILLSAFLLLTSFAAPAITNMIGATGTGGNYIFYLFGNNVSENATEIGVNIEGREENYKLFDSGKITAAKKTNTFGIGFSDDKNLLGDNFSVVPYEVVDGVKVTGEKISVSKNSMETADHVALEKLTVNGKAVAGFYSGTTETDFYYGLEELPGTAEELPEIEIASNHGKPEKGEVESYWGGYTVPYKVEYTNAFGMKLDKIFNIHFRAFSENTAMVYPHTAFQVQHGYLGAISDLTSVAQGSFKRYVVRSNGNIYSNNSSYLQYFAYDVPAIENYTPVYYDLMGVWQRTATIGDPFPVSAYSYDGNLKNVVYPKDLDDPSEELFKRFKGFNSSDEFLLRSFNESVKETGTVFSSTSVSEGENIIIWKSDDTNIANEYTLQYHTGYGGADNWKMGILVKYVEITPPDPTNTDTSIKTIKVNGKAAEGYDDESKTFYVATDSYENFDSANLNIEVETSVDGAKAVVSEYDNEYNSFSVTVTAKDGITSENYNVYVKELQTADLNWNAITGLIYSGSAYSTKNYASDRFMRIKRVAEEFETADNCVAYVEFDTSSLGKIALAGTTELSGTPLRNVTYNFYNTYFDEITSNCDYSELINGKAQFLAGMTSTNSTVNTLNTFTFDSSLLNLTEKGKIFISLVKGDVSSSVGQFSEPALKIGYINLEPNSKTLDNNTAISFIRVNGEEITRYNDELKKYYVPVETFDGFDINSYALEVEAESEKASIETFKDGDAHIIEFEVLAENGDAEYYTLEFKKVETADLSWSALTGLLYNGSSYTTANYASNKYLRGKRVAADLLTADTCVSYATFDTASLGAISLTGDAVLSGTPTRNTVYEFYNTAFTEITPSCDYSELINSNCELLGSVSCTGANKLANKLHEFKFSSSLISITEEGKIIIAMADGSEEGTLALFSEPVLKISYIVMN